MATEHKTLVGSSLLAALATVTVLPGAANAALTLYTTEADLVNGAMGAGGTLSFLEDFENHDPITNPFGYEILSSPLDGNPNGVFTDGINPGLSVAGIGGGLAAQVPGPYSGFITSTVVGTFQAFASLELTFTEPDVFAIGFDAWGIGSFIDTPMKEFDFEIFDTSGASLGSGNYATPDAETMGQFFGASSTEAIGSIVIRGLAFGADTKEYVDNVQAWRVPAPGALALFGLAGFAGTRRRRG